MTRPDKERLARMAEMAAMVLDARSVRLRAATEARAALLQQLAALDHPPPADPADSGAQQAFLAYEGWAAARRAAINLQLAQRHAEWLAAEAEARRAFGRKQVLEKIAAAPPRR